MEKREKKIVVHYPYGELIYIVKKIKVEGLTDTLDADDMECASIKETDITNIKGTALQNWKWNYLYDNVSTGYQENNKTSSTESINNRPPIHEFFTDFDEFSLSLMHLENSDCKEYDVKETDLLNLEVLNDVKETSLTGTDDEEYIKETDLTGSDDDFTDVSSLSSLTTINTGLSMNNLDRSSLAGISLAGISTDANDIFGSNTDLEETNIVDCDESIDSESKDEGKSMTFQDVESDYFETDCDTMDSGIFPYKESEYFQDIGSDFFDDDDDINTVHNNITSFPNAKTNTRNETHVGISSPVISPSSLLPPGKTATMSNSLLRSTITELERALSDSNRLLATRDDKIHNIRSLNIQLKKTLTKEVEGTKTLKHLLLEKDKTILEKETKIISLNQEIHDINNKLSELRSNRLSQIQQSSPISETHNSMNHISANNSCDNGYTEQPETFNISVNTPTPQVRTPDKDNNKSKSQNTNTPSSSRKSSNCTSPFSCNSPNSNTPSSSNLPNNNTPSSCKSVKRLSCRMKNINIETPENKPSECVVRQSTNDITNLSNNEKSEDDIKCESSNNGEIQANLRMKFMRDAFFYYMIGFHPDEQINAILAILEYGDRRQDFVLEAHNMKKVGKKFNASKVSSRGHSFVQEEFQ